MPRSTRQSVSRLAPSAPSELLEGTAKRTDQETTEQVNARATTRATTRSMQKKELPAGRVDDNENDKSGQKQSQRSAQDRYQQEQEETTVLKNVPVDTSSSEDASDDDEKVEEEEREVYIFRNVEYPTYMDMVNAKRRYNQEVMVQLGLLDAVEAIHDQQEHEKEQRRAKRRETKRLRAEAAKAATTTTTTTRRHSNRLAGIPTNFIYVKDERAGRFSFGGDTSASTTAAPLPEESSAAHTDAADNLIRERSSLTWEQAVDSVVDRWRPESVPDATALARRVLLNPSLCLFSHDNDDDKAVTHKRLSPRSVTRSTISTFGSLSSQPSKENSLREASSTTDLSNKIQSLQVETVAKVTPERIYGMAVHPSPHQLVVCAGDKQGHVGLWKVDEDHHHHHHHHSAETAAAASSSSSSSSALKNEPSLLFRYHTGAVCCLEWSHSGSKLLSLSYDGTIRSLDVTTERVERVFDKSWLTDWNEDSDAYHFYTQFMCLDHRSSTTDQCLFVSTSVGTALHLDLRLPESNRITFYKELSEKKINSLRQVQ